MYAIANTHAFRGGMDDAQSTQSPAAWDRQCPRHGTGRSTAGDAVVGRGHRKPAHRGAGAAVFAGWQQALRSWSTYLPRSDHRPPAADRNRPDAAGGSALLYRLAGAPGTGLRSATRHAV